MVMGEEDVAQPLERRAGDDELARHAVAAVHDVEEVVDDDHLRRRHVDLLGPWAAAGAEQDQPCPGALGLTPAGSPCPTGQHGGGGEKRPAAHVHLHASLP
jgi:hypothetical protein